MKNKPDVIAKAFEEFDRLVVGKVPHATRVLVEAAFYAGAFKYHNNMREAAESNTVTEFILNSTAELNAFSAKKIEAYTRDTHAPLN